MPLTTPHWSRPWRERGNIVLPVTTTMGDRARSVLWAWCACLVGTITGGTVGPEGPPPTIGTVMGSSDGVTAGMDGNDRGLASAVFNPAKWVRAQSGTQARSWIVIKIGNNWLLLDYVGAGDDRLFVYASRSPYSGGSITARPTAPNEFPSSTGVGLIVSEGVAPTLNTRAHYVTDGVETFIFRTSRDGSGNFNLFFAGIELSNPPPGATMNWGFSSQFTSQGGRAVPNISNLDFTTRNHNDTAIPGNGGVRRMQYGSSNQALGANLANEARFDALPLDVCYSASGWRGDFPDIYFIGSSGPPVGASYPSTGAQRFVVAGELMIPSSVVPIL